MNIFNFTNNDWLVSPKFSIPTATHQLRFDVGATQRNDTVAPTTPWEADDFVKVLVSVSLYTSWSIQSR